MLRPLRFASSIATSCGVLLLAGTIVGPGRTAAAGAPNWQPVRESPSSSSPARAASQWAPTRAPMHEAPEGEADSSAPQPSSAHAPLSAGSATAAHAAASRSAAAAPPAEPRWVLPNQKEATVDAGRNQLAREPKPFTPPTDAADIASATSPPRTNHTYGAHSAAFDPQSPQVPASTRPADRPPGGSHPSQSAPATTPSPHTEPPHRATNRSANGHHVAHGVYADRPRQPSFAERMRQTVHVAFDDRHAWAALDEAEDLPLPSVRRGQPGRSPGRMPFQGSSAYEVVGPEIIYEDDYGSAGMAYGAPGCPCDGGDIYCGDGFCQPGYGCEPSCGCPSREKDLFCLGWGDDEAFHTIRVRVPKWQELMIFAGAHGFKGPYDRDRDSGNFGFHEGVNAGFKVPYMPMGYQIGYQAVHSQLHGDKHTDISSSHTQHFLTAGVFQRVQDGLQFGVVWDMLHDERWGSVSFQQLRTEVAFIDRGCHEVGFAGTFGLNRRETFDDLTGTTTRWGATDQYLLFYRLHAQRGGEGRIYAGLTDRGDGILGSDMLLPVSDRWSVMTGFTYLIPDAPSGFEGASREAWNIGLALVWHWDCRARRSHSNCYRPLFNVANNGYMIIDDRPGRTLDLNPEPM